MTNPTSPGSFQCPHCGAPLEPERGVKTMQCKFCNATVTIPKELRTQPAPGTAAPIQTTPMFGKGCLRTLLIVGVIGVLLVAVLGVGGYLLIRNLTKNIPGVSSITSGFASKGMTFGAQGIGPGMFEDARSVAVAPDGNLVVGDYQDGRVETFSPSGKYLSYFTAGSGTGVDALAVGPDGNIYAAHDGVLSIYDPSGKELGQVAAAASTSGLTFGPDGSLYVITENDQVLRFDRSMNVSLTISNAFSSVLGMGESSAYIAVDGLGNIYIVGSDGDTVLKYSPSGQYLDKFGGRAESTGPAIPGTVFSASGLAVDAYGRVFLSDTNTEIVVFDSNGTVYQQVDALTLGFTTMIYGMGMDSQDRAYLALGNSVLQMKFAKP